jgi:hypothetical protein
VTRGRIAAVGVAVVTLVCVLLLAVLFVPRWWHGSGGSYVPRRTLVRTEVTPPRSLFGRVLTARAQVIVDPRVVDPASVQLDADLRPFNVREVSRRESDGPGAARTIEFAYQIQCLQRPCVPLEKTAGRIRGAATTNRLPLARLTARRVDGGKITRQVAWPTFGVQSRLTADEIAFSTPQAPTTFTPPKVTWGISPNVLGAASASLAVLFLLGAGWLVASVALRDTRRLRTARIPAHLSPIERALALAEHAAAHGEVDESRKALERLAAELRRRRAVEQAGDAERLAWSARGPSPETVAELADAVRSNGTH